MSNTQIQQLGTRWSVVVTSCAATCCKAQLLRPLLREAQDYIADHGKGSYIWTSDGQKHLDMGAGVRPG